MWYKISRNDYAKYHLFSNFKEIVTEVFHVIENMKNNLQIAHEKYKSDVKSNNNPDPYYEYPIVEQAKKDFGVKLLRSDELDSTIPLTCRNEGGFGSIAGYDNNGGVHINLQSHALRRQVNSPDDVARILAHELQHAVEHHYQNLSDTLSDKEKRKHKQWTDSAEQRMIHQGLEPLYLTRYYNQPTEVRARLAETLLHYGLPESKLSLQEKLANDNAYQNYYSMLAEALTPDTMSQYSNEAINYMVKELYKAIWN